MGAQMKGLSPKPGGHERPRVDQAENMGAASKNNFHGSNNKPMHPVSKVKSKSSPNKRK